MARESGVSPSALELLAELLDPRLDLGLETLGSLVLRDGAQHLAQARQPLIGVARLLEGGLHLSVLLAQVCRHGALCLGVGR